MKTNVKKTGALYAALAILAASSFIFSCKKDNTVTPTSSTAGYNMYMTDAPAKAYQQVNVNVTGAQVHSDVSGWVNLSIRPGIYNLLTLTNGKDTLIASGQIATGRVSQVRLILASSGNTVMANGTIYPLETPSDQQSGLKLDVDEVLTAGSTYNLLLDFDAGASVVDSGNNTYILKPVIRAVTSATSGSITGTIVPATALSEVTAVSVSGTSLSFSTFSSISSGKFLVQGVLGGTYTVTIIPPPPYTIQTISDVSVSNGQLSSIGTITLH